MDRIFRNEHEVFRELSLGWMKGTVRNACWAVTAKIPVFRDTKAGCYVSMAEPLCRAADVWLGSEGRYETTGELVATHKYISADPVLPGGDFILMWEDPTDHHVEPVNCMAYALMKIAYLKQLVEGGISCRKNDQKAGDFLEANGFAQHRGAVCTTVVYNGKLLVRFYDAISGATEDEDLECATYVAQKRAELLRDRVPNIRCLLQSVDGTVSNVTVKP